MSTIEIIKETKKACSAVAAASSDTKKKALLNMAKCILEDTDKILTANNEDVNRAKGAITDVMLDRLRLDENRIKAMADGILKVAEIGDPVGRILNEYTRDDGLLIKKVSVPFGVVGIIYESRPNVTADAAALAIMSGNACVLRGGKEAFSSASEIVSSIQRGLTKAGLPHSAVNLITDVTRESANEMMTANGLIDLLIPRGGAGLINACVKNATVPCIQTGTGICHVYVDGDADLDMAVNIIENAKMSRPSVCNAEEVCLVDRKIKDTFLPMLKKRLVDDRRNADKPVAELRCDEEAYGVIGQSIAGENDFDTEFLDYILAVKVVDGVDAACEHIASHSTGHSESIVTNNPKTAERFCMLVDSAAVYVNASTRFTDGGEFGLGCEMGISTQKLHARGPMGLSELNTYKYVIQGNGHIR